MRYFIFIILFLFSGIHSDFQVYKARCASENDEQCNPIKGDKVCYEELGCFGLEYPWTSLIRPFPRAKSPSFINVKLYLYTRNSTERYVPQLWPSISINGSDFNPNRNRTVFISHGFASNGNCSWMAKMKDAFLLQEDNNVFLVDWGKGASLANYLQVAANTRIVGAEVARFIRYLIKEKGQDPANIHLVGHSLGSHFCSYVAKNVSGIGRLTALDPAQPGFEGASSEVRLCKGDAKFTDVIHANAKPTFPLLGLGMMLPVGDVDFYMNGGLQQPGCLAPNVTTKIKSIKDFKNFTVEVLASLVSCSHSRSYEFFIAALEANCTFWGIKAGTVHRTIEAITLGYLVQPLILSSRNCTPEVCTVLGLDTPLYPARGSFEVLTSNHYPYCDYDALKTNFIVKTLDKMKSTWRRMAFKFN